MVDFPRPDKQAPPVPENPAGPRAIDTPGSPRGGRTDPLHVGDVVEERFEVIERLGSGSLGVVYRVQDRTMGEERALKAVYPELMVSARARERFVNQVRAALRLAHPYIVRVHDFGEDHARNLQFLTMELVNGVALERLLRLRDNRLPLPEALGIAEKIAEALHHAHQQTIHRDLKPQNVMILPDGAVKVLDFGLARLMTRIQFSQSALVMGTAYYQAPEVHLRHQPIDHRADIYSLGVILYEMATGQVPVGNFTLPTELLPDAPLALNRVVTRCLAAAVEDRFPSAAELLVALHGIANPRPGRIAAIVQAVRDHAVALPIFASDEHEDDPATPIEPVVDAPRDRFAAPTAVIIDRTTAEQARADALDAMERARAAGAEEHAARRFAVARQAFEDADAPLAANQFARAAAEYDAVTRAFETIIQRVGIAKDEKAQLQDTVQTLRRLKNESKKAMAGPANGAMLAEARALEQQARTAANRRDALDLLRKARDVYQKLLHLDAEPNEQPARHPEPSEESPPPDATRIKPCVAADVDRTCPSPYMPDDLVDITMPAQGPRVVGAKIPAPPAEQPEVAPAGPPSRAEARPSEVEAAVLLVPDEYPRIQAAIDAARADSTVRIRPGIYEENLVLKNGVKVIGEDRDTVIIRAPSGQASVVFAKNCRTGLISGVTIEHRQSQLGDVHYAGIKLHNSSIGVFRCTIQHTAGSGVIIKAGGAPTVRECLIQDNPWPGIYVKGGGSAPVLKRNVCARNGGRGIYFDGGAGGQAIENECLENRGSGISIHDRGTAPEIRLNTCTQNSEYGMYFGHGAGGVAEENNCTHNRISGISLHDHGTAPTLRRNTCAENGNDGIYFGDGAGGLAEENTCSRNKEDGIFVRDPGTAPRLVGNHCLANLLRGIEFGFGAHGTAEKNRCEQNAKEGIRVSNAGTAPRLLHNACVGNGTRGIYFSKGAGGAADSNLCETNKEIGLAVAGAGTNPTLRANKLERNLQYGLFIAHDATPTLERNQWANNGIADLNDDRPA